MRSVLGSPKRGRVTRRVGLSGALAAALLLAIALGGRAGIARPGTASAPSMSSSGRRRREELRRLFDAVVDAIKKSFWDKDRLAELNWLERMRGERAGVVASPDLQEAARRINLLLDELKTSHTVLLTPDDVDYYSCARAACSSVAAAPTPASASSTARIDGRDFIDLLLEGYPADRAGLKVGDEIVSVDGAPIIRSARSAAKAAGRSGRGSPELGRPYRRRSMSTWSTSCLSRRSATRRWPARGSSSRTAAASATCTCGPPSAMCRRWCRNPWSG